jgi:hypothetical protein
MPSQLSPSLRQRAGPPKASPTFLSVWEMMGEEMMGEEMMGDEMMGDR